MLTSAKLPCRDRAVSYKHAIWPTIPSHFITGFRRPALYSRECGSSTDNMFDKWNTYSWDLLALGLDQR